MEGYDQIGFDRSLTKPHLRREVTYIRFLVAQLTKQTEHRMQLICDGVQSKRDVLEFSIEQYKEVFIKARRDFNLVVEVTNHPFTTIPFNSPGAERCELLERSRGSARSLTSGWTISQRSSGRS